MGGRPKVRQAVLGSRLVVYLQLAALLTSVAVGRCGETWLGGWLLLLTPAVAWSAILFPFAAYMACRRDRLGELGFWGVLVCSAGMSYVQFLAILPSVQ